MNKYKTGDQVEVMMLFGWKSATYITKQSNGVHVAVITVLREDADKE